MIGWVLAKEQKFIGRAGHPKISLAWGQEGTGTLGEGEKPGFVAAGDTP